MRLQLLSGANAEAGALLRALPGVSAVLELDRAGEYESFEIRGGGELCEPIGRLCHAQGWVVRELSLQRPTLEKIFARVAFELEPDGRSGGSP